MNKRKAKRRKEDWITRRLRRAGVRPDLLRPVKKLSEAPNETAMKLHPRLFIVQQAENRLSGHLLDVCKEFHLTDGEVVKILASRLLAESKYIIRGERHPGQPDKKGDEA